MRGGIVDRHCLYKYCHIGPAQLQNVAELYFVVAYYMVIQYTIIAFILVEHRKLSTRYSALMKAIAVLLYRNYS